MNSPIFIPGESIVIEQYDIEPIEGFTPHDNFPNCCKWHKSVKESAEKWFERFPDCCDDHRNSAKRIPKFSKDKYKGVIDKILKQLAYTEHLITTRINNDDWLADISEYVEYSHQSFGHPGIGEHVYLNSLRGWFQTDNRLPEDKRLRLIDYFTPNTKPKPEPIDVKILFNTYAKWLRSFPFELSYFNLSKEHFEHSLPLLAEAPVGNRYTGMAKAKLIDTERLTAFLHDLTKQMLSKIDTVKLLEDGLITEPKKMRIELVNANHRIATEAILNEYAKGERKYINTIKSWLAQQKQYFKEISEVIAQPIVPEPPPVDKLVGGLSKYGFYEVPKVKVLDAQKKEQLFELIRRNKLPYRIAMLHYLGFIEYAIDNHFSSQFKLIRTLIPILDAKERDIKGNLNVLKARSGEDKERYKAHAHMKAVENDYQNIK